MRLGGRLSAWIKPDTEKMRELVANHERLGFNNTGKQTMFLINGDMEHDEPLIRGGFEILKEFGYDTTDCNLVSVACGALKDATDEELKAYYNKARAIADEVGMGIEQVHGPWRYPPKDGTVEDRAEWFGMMVREMEACAYLGCKHFVIHPLMPYGAWQNPNPEEFWKINFDFFSELVKVAEKLDVIINFENMPFPALTLARPQEIVDFVKAIDSPHMRVCLDTGHSLVCGVPIEDAVRQIGKEYLTTFHIHGNNGKEDIHWLPFTGVGNWHAFAEALREIGYEGALTVECSVEPPVPDTVRFEMEQTLVDSLNYLADIVEKEE